MSIVSMAGAANVLGAIIVGIANIRPKAIPKDIEIKVSLFLKVASANC